MSGAERAGATRLANTASVATKSEVAASLRRRQRIEKELFDTQLRLASEDCVDAATLRNSALLMQVCSLWWPCAVLCAHVPQPQPAHFDEVVTERSIDKHCGYPTCSNRLSVAPHDM